MKKTKSGVYINDTWETFLAQRDGLSNWKIPLIIATTLHLIVFTGFAVFPDVNRKFELDSVVTIDLLSLPSNELAGGHQAPQQLKTVRQVVRKTTPAAAKVKRQRTKQAAVLPVVTPKKKIKVARITPKITPKNIPTIVPESVSEVVEKPVSTSQSVTEVEPVKKQVKEVKQISLRPLKRKKKLVQDVRLAEVKEQEGKKRQEQLEQRAALKKKRLAAQQKQKKAAEAKKLAARKKKQEKAAAKKRWVEQQRRERESVQATRLARQAEQAAEQARLEADQLRQEYASAAQIDSELNMPLTSGNSGSFSDEGRGGHGSSGGERINPAVLNQYAASLNGRISSHWKLPEIVKKKPNLRTVIALTVRRNGTIKDMRIEEKSGDNFFDQFVIKALQSAEPLPGFPALIDKSTLEFTLNFTSQGLAL